MLSDVHPRAARHHRQHRRRRRSCRRSASCARTTTIPYLVVAADKGTATFSDIANALSAEYSFWLGDAFASGGSAGYDHKKIAITARGAWEAVKRHFRELGVDPAKEDFTIVGIGDMSGDVFGNGLLLSPHMKLVAAFDHRHIFVDPSPDPAKGIAERRRLFELPRSSWDDYDRGALSEGGGVYSRQAKSIELHPKRAGRPRTLPSATVTPLELIRAVHARARRSALERRHRHVREGERRVASRRGRSRATTPCA